MDNALQRAVSRGPRQGDDPEKCVESVTWSKAGMDPEKCVQCHVVQGRTVTQRFMKSYRRNPRPSPKWFWLRVWCRFTLHGVVDRVKNLDKENMLRFDTLVDFTHIPNDSNQWCH